MEFKIVQQLLGEKSRYIFLFIIFSLEKIMLCYECTMILCLHNWKLYNNNDNGNDSDNKDALGHEYQPSHDMLLRYVLEFLFVCCMNWQG